MSPSPSVAASQVRNAPRLVGAVLLVAAALAPSRALAQPVVTPPFAADYTISDLGSIVGVPTNYGGLTFKDGDPNKIIIGGAANGSGGNFYVVSVTRSATTNEITGFSGSATLFSAGAYNDGGLAYGPGGVLFYARYPVAEIGQIKPGSTTVNKVTALGPLGVSGSLGGLTFVPAGYPGAGQLKIVAYNGSQGWYSVAIAPDGSGTYNLTSATAEATLSGGPEGVVYVPPGSPGFIDFGSVLVAEYGAGKIVTYDIDTNGDPKPATRREFVTGLSGAEGAAIDPLTGDFLFSTYGGGNKVLVVRGFAAPSPDLVETSVTGVPPQAVLKGKFTVTDTAQNVGGGPAAASSTRYYLSTDAVRNAGDRLLGGLRKVPLILAGASSTGVGKLTVPAAAKVGVYRLLACADDRKVVDETDEANNCVASATTIQIKAPDLTTTALGAPPATIARGASFTASDTVANGGDAAAGPSTTQYVLSLDAKRSTADLILGTRAVLGLAIGANSAGSTSVTVPLSTTVGSYYLLACADGLKKVAESNEKNNCRASATKVAVN